MRVAFLYNRSSDDPTGAAEDDVPAASPIVAALRRLGHRVTPIVCNLNLSSVRRRLARAKPDVVFNRVESLGGSDAMMAAPTLLLDTMGIPYTGCPTAALVAAASKLTVKKQLVRAGLPTPKWIEVDCTPRIAGYGLQHSAGDSRFILKSELEHASFRLDDRSIVGPASADEIVHRVRQLTDKTRRPHFAEQFVEGREFNLALLGEGPLVLPPAEIDFSAFPHGKPRIVGHGAKWDGSSFEYHNTPRRFDFPPGDTLLLQRVTGLAVDCWQMFELRGYARIDFRVDAANQPWILEINTNPCMSPDAGFAAALQQADISYDDGIQRILDDAMTRSATRTPHKHRRTAHSHI